MEHIKEIKFTLHVETNKRSIHEDFESLEALKAAYEDFLEVS